MTAPIARAIKSTFIVPPWPRSGGTFLSAAAAEIRMRAERRLGELIRVQKETVGLNAGGRPTITGSKSDPVTPTLSSVGIDKHLADRARKLSAVPEAQFEGMLGEWRERVADETERVTARSPRPAQAVPAGCDARLPGEHGGQQPQE